MTLKYGHLTLRMTSDVLKNVTIELADPQNPQIDAEIVPLFLLELILAQLNQWTQLKKPYTYLQKLFKGV